MDWHGIFVQGVGFVGLFFFLLSYQLRTNKKFFAAQTLGCMSFAAQFVLLGGYSGCLGLSINIVRNIMLQWYNQSAIIRWKGWIVVFSVAVICASALTWNGWLSILPVLATIVGTTAFWSNNARYIRLADLFFMCPCYLFYDFFVHSYGGMINESITMLSILFSIYRFGWAALDGDVIE